MTSSTRCRDCNNWFGTATLESKTPPNSGEFSYSNDSERRVWISGKRRRLPCPEQRDDPAKTSHIQNVQRGQLDKASHLEDHRCQDGQDDGNPDRQVQEGGWGSLGRTRQHPAIDKEGDDPNGQRHRHAEENDISFLYGCHTFGGN